MVDCSIGSYILISYSDDNSWYLYQVMFTHVDKDDYNYVLLKPLAQRNYIGQTIMVDAGEDDLRSYYIHQSGKCHDVYHSPHREITNLAKEEVVEFMLKYG